MDNPQLARIFGAQKLRAFGIAVAVTQELASIKKELETIRHYLQRDGGLYPGASLPNQILQSVDALGELLSRKKDSA